MMCGGSNNIYCYYMDITDPNPTFTRGPELNQYRSYADAIPLKNASLWIIDNGQDQTEIVSLNEAIPGPSLPKTFKGPCILKYNESSMAIFDGEDFLFYNFESNQWSEGPSKSKSYYSGCAMFQYSTSQYIVVGGGFESTDTLPIKKVNIFDVDKNSWYTGKIWVFT